MSANGLGVTLSVTATSQDFVFSDPARDYTLINTGANSINYRESGQNVTGTTYAGIESVLLGLGGCELAAGRAVLLPGVTLNIICATDDLSTVVGVLGDLTGAYSGSGGSTDELVFSSVVITEAVAGVADLGVVANATDVIRLHALAVTMRAQGDVTINYSDDADGVTNPVALSGAIVLGAGGGINIGFISEPDGCLKTITDASTFKHMVVDFGTAGGDGYAIISKGAA